MNSISPNTAAVTGHRVTLSGACSVSSSRLLALWDSSAGGTGNCVAYAERKAGYEVVKLHSQWLEFQKEFAKTC